ncbi:MAG TPA: PEP-CTERM sorting domain-containing protein [Glaciihabitans sp.]|nr:PEP-CTERM sorting domain-containing protein [Glaciihabitans sp.]
MSKSSRRSPSSAILASLIAVTAPLSLTAADKFWDLNGVTIGAGVAPAGEWNTADLNWNPLADGTSSPVAWESGDSGFFSAGSDATGAFTVNLGTAQTASAVTVEEGDITFTGGAITLGTGQLTINTAARVSIPASAQISSTGGVVLNGGTIRNTNVTNALAFLPGTTPIIVGANGGTIDYTSSSGTPNFVSLYTGTILGTGTLTKTGVNEIRVQGANQANNTYSKLVVKQGLFRIGNVSGANFETGFGAVPATETPDAITLDGGSLGLSVLLTLHANRGITIGPSGGTFFGSGGGVITLPGPLSGSGKITLVSGGGLNLQNANNVTTFTGAVQVDLGTLTLTESLNATNLTGAPPAAVNGSVSVAASRVFTVGSDNTSTTYGNVIAGAGQFTKVGTGTLSIQKEWTITGATNINAGTLRYDVSAAGLGNSSQITIGPSGTMDMNNVNDTVGSLAGSGPILNGGNLTINGNNASAATYSGSFSGVNVSRTLTKNGAGTQVLAGSYNVTSAVVNAGSLLVSGSISGSSPVTVGSAATPATSAIFGGSGTVGNVTANGTGDAAASGGTVDPGNTANVAGILNTGALTITNGGHLSLQIGGSTAGGESAAGYDRLVASGGVSLAGGDLKLTLQGTPVFAEGSTLFVVVNNSGTPVTGTFSTLNNAPFDASNFTVNGQAFQLTYLANFAGAGSDGIGNDVALIAVPEPGAWVAMLGGMAVLAGFRRSQRSRLE